jgi:CRISPR-associated protein Cmr1
MRKEPDITPPADIVPRKLDIIEQRRKYKLITPLYGGGVNPNEADPVSIVRATEIRAQLRFWWRASRGWQFGDDPDAMRNAEGAIWGKAYEKGDQGLPLEQTIQITVSIDTSGRGEPIKPFTIQNGRPRPSNGIPGYAAFPLQPDEKERRKPQPHILDVQKAVSFTLIISYPTTRRKDAEAALWAWETFGGLGARTRRGFGSLHLLAINDIPHREIPAAHQAEAWIKNTLGKYIEPGSFPTGVPHLSGAIQLVVTIPYSDPMQAWNSLIRELQQFRQRKDAAGRSVWPEAEAIRAITGKALKNKQPGPQKFPRAAFGLPIIFHFTGVDEPADTTLQEASNEDEARERFASPLILRPFLCSDNRAVGLALLLEGSQVDLQHLILEDDQKTPHPVRGTLMKSEARQIAGLDGETNVLRAFINSLKDGR